MLKVFTNAYGNRYRAVDVHAVQIDGRIAYDMPLVELQQEARKLGVVGITNQTGRQEAIVRLGIFQQEQLEKQGYQHDRDGVPYRPEVIKQPTSTPSATVAGGTQLKVGESA